MPKERHISSVDVPHPPSLSPSGPPQTAPTIRLRINLLGRMQARDAAGRSILPRSRKTRAILAVLALSAPRPVLRAELSAMLWSTRNRLQANGSLRQSIHELLGLVAPLGGDLLLADRSHLALRREALWLDTGSVVAPSEPLLEDLVGLDAAFDAWLAGERRRLARMASAVAESALAVCATPVAIAAAAERLLTIDPVHDGAGRAAISAYGDLGDRDRAVAVYERYAASLAELLGTSPGWEMRALLAAIPSTPAGIAARDKAGAMGNATPGAASSGPAWRTAPRLVPLRRLRVRVPALRQLGGEAGDPLPAGLASEIIHELARFHSMYLVAGGAAAPGQQEVGSGAVRGYPEMGVGVAAGTDLDLVLDGSVQRGVERVRVMFRLLDMAAAGEVVWAQRFDPGGVDDLTLQEEIAGKVAAQLDPLLIQLSARRAAAHPEAEMTADDLVLRALPPIYRLEEVAFREAGADLSEAVAREPEHAQAHSWLACWHIFLHGQGWAGDDGASLGRAGQLADRAIMLDPGDARGLSIAGHVQAFLYHQTNAAIGLHDRALVLNPNLPLSWALSGLAFCYAGRHEEAIRRIHRACELSPFDPHAFFFETALMVPHLLRGEFETVLEIGRQARVLNPLVTSTYKAMLASLGHLGRLQEAALVRAELLRLDPAFNIRRALTRSPLRADDDLLYAEGLRRGGLPE